MGLMILKGSQTVNKKSVAIFILAGLAALTVTAILLSCSSLEQEYIRRDKFFRIAFIEDSRADDSLLISPEYISDPDPEIRARTALAIGRIGGNFYTAALMAHLRDTALAAAEAKYFAAGLLGDSTLFDSLFLLAKTRPLARDVAVEALGRVADSAQSPKIADFLTASDSLVQYQALLALWRAGQWSQASKMAEIALLTGSRKVQYGALYALARGGRIEGRQLFINTLSDPDPEFRMLAYAGLGKSADTASIKLIAGGLNDADNRVVAAAMYALGNFGSLGSIFIGEKLPGLTDEKVTALGVDIIGKNPGFANSAAIVRRILVDDTRDNVLASAAGALLEIDGVKALVTIDQKLTAPTVEQKLAIARGIVGLDPQAALARLTPLFNDPAATVRAAALESLCRVDSTSAVNYIATALADTDLVVEATAVDLAAKRNLTSQIPAIAALYLDHRNTIDDDLKRTIIDAFNTYTTDSTYDSLVIATLEEGCNDEWFIIRGEASKVLWDKFKIDRRGQVQRARSFIEKTNYRQLFDKYKVNPLAVLETARGSITLELFYHEAPMTVNNFISLAEKGFYDNLIFHRVVPNFVIQDGCPRGDGWGGPGYAIRSEFNRVSYSTGTLGMANSGKDTGGSQYFITLSPQPYLDARYTAFGRVIEGLDIVQQIVRGDAIKSVTIKYSREDK
jgi:cyclophilin family peptidyl-prolyl cis-trans isomerase/HEAT repeat protein